MSIESITSVTADCIKAVTGQGLQIVFPPSFSIYEHEWMKDITKAMMLTVSVIMFIACHQDHVTGH